jgi:hypothetical protein
MKKAAVLLGLLVLACNAPHGSDREFRDAQGLVNRMVERHPEIIWLSIHAVPTGQSRCQIIACSQLDQVGQASYREDIEAIQTRTAAVFRAGGRVEVTAPILDGSGKAIAAVGVTFQKDQDTSEEALVNQAKSLAREMSGEIQDAGRPMW